MAFVFVNFRESTNVDEQSEDLHEDDANVPATYEVRLTFSGTDQLKHAHKRVVVLPDMDTMDLIVAALEYCSFETLPMYVTEITLAFL